MASKQISEKDLRMYGLVLGLILTFIGFLHFRKGHITLSYWLDAIGAVIAFVALIKTDWINPVYKVLTPIFEGIGWINTRLLLGIVFYLVITPIGLLMRLFGKDLLYRKLDKNAASYWIIRDGKPLDSKHYEKQF